MQTVVITTSITIQSDGYMCSVLVNGLLHSQAHVTELDVISKTVASLIRLVHKPIPMQQGE